MSKEVALAFFEVVDKSPDLQRQIKPLDEHESPDNIKKFLEIASKAGYTFTVDDLSAAAKVRAGKQVQSGELSEEDLEKVAGGMWCVCTGCCVTSIRIG
ncbi:MAG TPA: Nif11-like leader peptide family RiPP precursor [Aggregatilineales bacterium]|nr:Nif11-like leader peptide family RiPP precursor [Aggregatilineales bacterium]